MTRRPTAPPARPLAKLLTTAEVADLFGVTDDCVRNWIYDGALPASNIARRGGQPKFRVHPADAAAFFEARRVSA